MPPEFGETSAASGELLDRALLDYFSIVDEQHLIGVADRAGPVRDDDAGATAWIVSDRVGDGRLVLGVQCAGGFVDQQDSRRLHECSRDADPLTLATG